MVLGAFVAYAVLAFYIYRPLSPRPFDMIDFSEFLPILRAHDSFWARLAALVDYYANHGRFNLLVYVSLSLKWSLFGASEVGWQLTRAVQMLVLTAASYALLRRLNVGTAGALLAAGFFVVSAPAARAWIRLTMAEPFGTTVLVSAAICATYYQRSTRWPRLAVVIALLVALLLLAKEMFIATVPFIMFISWCRRADGHFGRPQRTRRNLVLLAVVTLATGLALVPVLIVAMRASSGAYVSAYGSFAAEPFDVFRLALFTVIPFVIVDDPMPAGLAVAGVCYFGLLAIGLRLFANVPRGRSDLRAILAIGLVHPLLGATAYLPWPVYHWFYSVPFLVGPAALVGAGVSGVERVVPRQRLIAYAAVLFLLATMASESIRFSRRSEATQVAIAAAIDAVSAIPERDSAFVAVAGLPVQAWQGFGQTLARHAAALGRPIPATFNVSCANARQRARHVGERNILLVFSTECPREGSPTMTMSRPFEWFDWGRAEWRRDSISFAVFSENTIDGNRHPK